MTDEFRDELVQYYKLRQDELSRIKKILGPDGVLTAEAETLIYKYGVNAGEVIALKWVADRLGIDLEM